MIQLFDIGNSVNVDASFKLIAERGVGSREGEKLRKNVYTCVNDYKLINGHSSISLSLYL